MSDSSQAGAAPQRSAAKTLLLWSFLICLFAAFYAYDSSDPRMAWRIGKTGLSLFFIVFVYWALRDAFRQRRPEDTRRWEAPAREALRSEDSGALDAAARQWEALANQAPRDSAARAGFILHQAWVCLRGGQGQQALQLLEPLLSHADSRERELAHALLALVMAVRGHLPRAESLLKGLQDEGVPRSIVGGLASQVLLSRRGEYAEALALAVPPWDVADPLCRHFRQLWALLRAFALEHLPPTPERERDARRTRAELRGLRPGEFDFLTEGWPELRAFLDARLSEAEAPASPKDTSASLAEPGPQAFSSGSFGLGLPARYEPLRSSGGSSGIRPLFALLGGFVFLILLNGTLLWFEIPLLGVLVAATLLVVWGPMFQARRAHALNLRGIDAQQASRPDEAARFFDASMDAMPHSAMAEHRQMLLFNRAVAALLVGERSLARRIFHALAHQSPSQVTPRMRALGWEYLAECEALAGNAGRARVLGEVAAKLWGNARLVASTLLPLLLAFHEESPARVSQVAEELLAKPGLPERFQRQVRLLQAFALARVESPTPEQQEKRAQLQEQLRRQARPGEFDDLAAEWPELRAFLDELGTTRAAA